MKWYSINKYKPCSFQEGLLVRHVVEGYAYINEGSFCEHKFSIFNSLRQGEITHFAIPDPIEIEDENTQMLPKNLIPDED